MRCILDASTSVSCTLGDLGGADWHLTRPRCIPTGMLSTQPRMVAPPMSLQGAAGLHQTVLVSGVRLLPNGGFSQSKKSRRHTSTPHTPTSPTCVSFEALILIRPRQASTGAQVSLHRIVSPRWQHLLLIPTAFTTMQPSGQPPNRPQISPQQPLPNAQPMTVAHPAQLGTAAPTAPVARPSLAPRPAADATPPKADASGARPGEGSLLREGTVSRLALQIGGPKVPGGVRMLCRSLVM